MMNKIIIYFLSLVIEKLGTFTSSSTGFQNFDSTFILFPKNGRGIPTESSGIGIVFSMTTCLYYFYCLFVVYKKNSYEN
jgi:hypothetical protein